MSHTFLRPILLIVNTLLLLSLVSSADDHPRSESDEPEIESTPSLPQWEEDYHVGFDVRLWPEDTILWLEQEHLRSLIDDPELPDQERQKLKEILASQQAAKQSS